jgi:hypothetical protein
MNIKKYLFIILFNANAFLAFSQFTVNAGNDKMLCPGENYILGGIPAATGGLAPYTYSWSPNIALSSTNTPNPTCTSTGYVEYTLTVVDDTGANAYSGLGPAPKLFDLPAGSSVINITATGANEDTQISGSFNPRREVLH